MAKKIAPVAIVALKEALTHLYWYKSDLQSFLTTTLANPSLLANLNWDDYKRNVVSTLVDFIAKRPDQYQGDLLRLMSEVSRVSDFSHLERLEGGAEKAAKARASVRALEKLTRGHDALAVEEEKVEERRRQAHEQLLRTTAVRDGVEKLSKEYMALLVDSNHQSRGFRLERQIGVTEDETVGSKSCESNPPISWLGPARGSQAWRHFRQFGEPPAKSSAWRVAKSPNC